MRMGPLWNTGAPVGRRVWHSYNDLSAPVAGTNIHGEPYRKYRGSYRARSMHRTGIDSKRYCRLCREYHQGITPGLHPSMRLSVVRYEIEYRDKRIRRLERLVKRLWKRR